MSDDSFEKLASEVQAARRAAEQAIRKADKAAKAADQAKLEKWKATSAFLLLWFEEYKQCLENESPDACTSKFLEILACVVDDKCCQRCVSNCANTAANPAQFLLCVAGCDITCRKVCVI